jgi:hypothetical protein
MILSIAVLILLFVAQGVYRNRGRDSFDALPPHLGHPHDWDGKDDDDHWYTKWQKSVKGWFAFGPLSAYRWAQFRERPVALLGLRGRGFWRHEDDQAAVGCLHLRCKHLGESFYLSRVQYWTNWHIALQWPLFLHGHAGNWQAYIGLKRDADRVYWLAVYFGRIWK